MRYKHFIHHVTLTVPLALDWWLLAHESSPTPPHPPGDRRLHLQQEVPRCVSMTWLG